MMLGGPRYSGAIGTKGFMSNVFRKALLFPSLFSNFVRVAGWRPALIWTVYRTKEALGLPPSRADLASQKRSTITLKPPSANHLLTARLEGATDIRVFAQIFV